MPIPVGVLAGLGAMLGWGVADYLSALTSRKISAFQAYTLNLFVATVLSLFLAFLFKISLALPPVSIAKIFVVSIVITLGTYSFFRGLEIGKVLLLSPLSSVWPVLTIVLSILVYREYPSPLQLLGAAIIVAGGIIATLDWGEIFRKPRLILSDPGTVWIFGAIILWGVGYTFYSPLARENGWFVVATWSWVPASILFALAALALRRKIIIPSVLLIRWQIVALGAFNVFAFASYALGVARDLAAVVAPVGGLYAVVTMILSYLFLKERLTRIQFLGIFIALAGLLLLSVQ